MGEMSLRCSTAGAATRGEITTDADEDVGDEEGEHCGQPLQHLIGELAAGALLRQEDDESRDPVPPRGCTRAAREVRISKGIGKRREGERKRERKDKKERRREILCRAPFKTRRSMPRLGDKKKI